MSVCITSNRLYAPLWDVFTGYLSDKWAVPAIGIIDALVLANNPKSRLEKQ
jgi:hypothetical protein